MDPESIRQSLGGSSAFGVHDGAKLVKCSPELAAMFGYESPEEVVGKTPLEFIDRAHWDKTTREIMDGATGPYVTVGIRANGVRFRIEIRGERFQWGEQDLRGVSVRDLTPCVLVVDDEPMIVRLIGSMLMKIGYQVVRAGSGQDAVAKFSPGEFAFVATDIVMPGIGGVELATRLREAEPDIPIIFLSGYSAADPPLDDHSTFIRKPFGMDDIMQGLSRLPERARKGIVV
jgi:PAS domain S-box-containing protein